MSRQQKKSKNFFFFRNNVDHRLPFALFPLLVFFLSPPVSPVCISTFAAFRFSPTIGAFDFRLTTDDFPAAPPLSLETCASAADQSTFWSLIAYLSGRNGGEIHEIDALISPRIASYDSRLQIGLTCSDPAIATSPFVFPSEQTSARHARRPPPYRYLSRAKAHQRPSLFPFVCRLEEWPLKAMVALH